MKARRLHARAQKGATSFRGCTTLKDAAIVDALMDRYRQGNMHSLAASAQP